MSVRPSNFSSLVTTLISVISILLLLAACGDTTTDGNLDETDSGTTGDGSAAQQELCENGFDDNANGSADCEDSQCRGEPACDGFVGTPPTVSIEADDISGYGVLETRVQAVVEGGTAPYTFDWTVAGDAILSAEQIVEPMSIPAVTGSEADDTLRTRTITVTVTDIDGDATEATLDVSVIEDLLPLFEISADPVAGPLPSTVQFTSVVTSGNADVTMAWNFGDGGSSTDDNPTHTFEQTNSYVVEAIATDGSGDVAFASIIVSAGTNLPPSDPDVDLGPLDMSTDSTLQCSATGSLDPEGGDLTYEYHWYVNELPEDSESVPLDQTGDTIANSDDETLFGTRDLVICQARAYDGGVYSEWVTSPWRWIDNAAPTAPGVVLTVDTSLARHNSVFTCSASGSTDSDTFTEVFYLYLWTADGDEIDGATDETLQNDDDNDYFRKGDDVACHVRATDGQARSDTIDSNVIPVVNTPPLGPDSADLSPDPANGIDTLTCVATGGSDADGDGLTFVYAWTVNGDLLGLETTNTLSNPPDEAYFRGGDVVTCLAGTHDGEASSTNTATDSVTIGNSPPTVLAHLAIDGRGEVERDRAESDETPRIIVDEVRDLEGDDVALTYAWQRHNGADFEDISGATGETLDPSNTDEGDLIRGVAQGNDGLLTGPRFFTEPMVINAIPVITDVLCEWEMEPGVPLDCAEVWPVSGAELCFTPVVDSPDGALEELWTFENGDTGSDNCVTVESDDVLDYSFDFELTVADAQGDSDSTAGDVGVRTPSSLIGVLRPAVDVPGRFGADGGWSSVAPSNTRWSTVSASLAGAEVVLMRVQVSAAGDGESRDVFVAPSPFAEPASGCADEIVDGARWSEVAPGLVVDCLPGAEFDLRNNFVLPGFGHPLRETGYLALSDVFWPTLHHGRGQNLRTVVLWLDGDPSSPTLDDELADQLTAIDAMIGARLADESFAWTEVVLASAEKSILDSAELLDARYQTLLLRPSFNATEVLADITAGANLGGDGLHAFLDGYIFPNDAGNFATSGPFLRAGGFVSGAGQVDSPVDQLDAISNQDIDLMLTTRLLSAQSLRAQTVATMVAPEELTYPDEASFGQQVVSGNFDGNGAANDDIAVCSVYLNDDDGVLGTLTTVYLGTGDMFTFDWYEGDGDVALCDDFHAVDLDNDFRDDLVSIGTVGDGAYIQILYYEFDELFDYEFSVNALLDEAFGEAEWGTDARSLAFSDLDRDGFLDWLIGVPDSGATFPEAGGWVIAMPGQPQNGRDETPVDTENAIIFNASTIIFIGHGTDAVDIDCRGDEDPTDNLFGWAIATGDFDDDLLDSVVIGAPAADVYDDRTDSSDLEDEAGAVYVFRLIEQAAAECLIVPSDCQFIVWEAENWTCDMLTQVELGDAAENDASDWFGATLATGQFGGLHAESLAIGSPNDEVSGLGGAGKVFVVPGYTCRNYAIGDDGFYDLCESQSERAGLAISDGFTIDLNDVGGSAGTGENFGALLTAADVNHDYQDDLVIGAPNDTVSGVSGVGSFAVVPGHYSSHRTGLLDSRFYTLGQLGLDDPDRLVTATGNLGLGGGFSTPSGPRTGNGLVFMDGPDGYGRIVAGAPGLDCVDNTDCGGLFSVAIDRYYAPISMLATVPNEQRFVVMNSERAFSRAGFSIDGQEFRPSDLSFDPFMERLFAGHGGGASDITEYDPQTGEVLARWTNPVLGTMIGIDTRADGRLIGTYIFDGGGGSFTQLSDIQLLDEDVANFELIGYTGTRNMAGLTYDLMFDNLYGMLAGGDGGGDLGTRGVPPADGDPGDFYRVDDRDGFSSLIAASTYPAEVSSLGFTPDGRRLLAGGSNGVLYEIDPRDGSWRVIGDMGVNKISGIAWGPTPPYVEEIIDQE